ncbi:MAG: GGDEF domain-containing protein [Rubrivivax sp.]|nr:GGDEF domain-containing protein [Rubrivivax sp.]
MSQAAPGAARADEPAALITQAWQQSYFDAARALALGRRIVELTRDEPSGVHAAFGWLHVALAQARGGDAVAARDAAAKAREGFRLADHRRGLALVDEVLAIERRRAGDVHASAALQADIDARGDVGYDDHDRFVAHNSRAITAKRLGRADEALRHFYAAHAAARRTGWPGPIVLSLSNLSGHHLDLHNLDDARRLGEEALQVARESGARHSVATIAANLIVTHHALGRVGEARAMGEFLRTHLQEAAAAVPQRLAAPLALAHLAVGEIDAAERQLAAVPPASAADADSRAVRAWIAARCLLARGQAAQSLAVTREALADVEQGRAIAQPYDLLQLHRAAADAAEQGGDLAAALASTKRSQAQYEELVGRSARARYIALEVAHQMDATRHERDQAVESRRTAENDREHLAALNEQLRARMAETQRLQRQLEEQALRDPLTGLNNRRYLFEMAPRLIDLAARAKNTLCVVLVDLDRFKQLNDTYGHQAGDEVLKAFAVLLRQSLRRSDILCRHGGEEFVIVMPEISGDGAEAMLTRLLAIYGELRLNSGLRQLPSGSFSAGVAVYPTHGSTLDQLLSRADRALYAAKDAGRARVEQAQITQFSSLD